MSRRRKREYDLDLVSDINVTSLVDVMMTLLIIFIIVAPMIEQGIDITLPTAEPKRIDVAETLTITVAENERIYLEGQRVTMEELAELATELRHHGISLTLDFVFNHTSEQHPWFQRARKAAPRAPERDWYVWSDDPDRCYNTSVLFSPRAAAASGPSRAPTAMARFAAAGVPTELMPGPSLPADVTNTTPGFFHIRSSTYFSMALVVSRSEPMPKLML
mgnify:CR=1 FL=1